MKKSLLFVFALVFVLSYLSAADTEVNIMSYPNHDIMISALTPDSVYSLIESFYGKTDSEGKFSKIIPISQTEFDLKVWIRNANTVAVTERFDGISSGEKVYFIMLPGNIKRVDGFNESKNETEVNNTEAANDTSQNITEETENIGPTEVETESSSITGSATEKDTGESSPKSMYYLFGALLLALVFMSVLAIKRKSSGEEKEVKVRKFSDFKKEQEEARKDNFIPSSDVHSSDYKKAIEEAEKKIDEAQKEIRKLKNEDRIKDVKRKLIEDEKELLKLRKGEI
ncbi:MAG: hypothetical protein AABW50_00840 [Nanoarchaeota archaeon]